MATLLSGGAPELGRRSTLSVRILGEDEEDGRRPTNILNISNKRHDPMAKYNGPAALQSDTLSNRQPAKPQGKVTIPTTGGLSTANTSTGMEEILTRLRLNDSRKQNPARAASTSRQPEADRLNKVLTTFHDQNKALKRQGKEIRDEFDSDHQRDADRCSNSDLFTPASGSLDLGSHEGGRTSDTIKVDLAEMIRVKKELEAARSVISRQEQELAESRHLKHTMDQALGSPSQVDFGTHSDMSDQTMGHAQSAFNASARPFTSRGDVWLSNGYGRSDQSDSLPASTFPQTRSIWSSPPAPMNTSLPNASIGSNSASNPRDVGLSGSPFGSLYGTPPSAVHQGFRPPPTFSNTSSAGGYNGRPTNDMIPYNSQMGGRNSQAQYRSGSTWTDTLPLHSSYSTNVSAPPAPLPPVRAPAKYGYQPRGVPGAISPLGPDFSSTTVPTLATQGPLPVASLNGLTYATPLEPMNYRRLLDKSVSCDWKYIVDKIVCNNDQQASIFLQQKLKVGTAPQKFDIVQSIISQAYPLMVNRFGNFLVQRCFEHGTPEQVVAIAHAIHGHVLPLSMDPFGCHVIQKAFDSVPEDHKTDMVKELLRRIPDTVIHRYACHVWQKLLELRWNGEPPQIMTKVNEALRGMWHEVALGETGSLVVQNIFENCIEEEKRPAVEEVIANIDLIAHGQFGNWCIQHLCEHGSSPDKRRAIDHILANAYHYSIDQFASKVIEKCLKICGVEFLDHYLGAITTTHPDRPRIPLIDIAGDQYGNYLIQWILMNAHHHQREQVAVHIRKHMVSLRGSKFGCRVAMLCCNPHSTTRPGPGAIANPFAVPVQSRHPWPRFR